MLKTSIFKIQVNCPSCNTLHALSGLHEQETCLECGKIISLQQLFLRRIFTPVVTVHYMNAFLSGTIEQIGGGAVGQAGAYKMTYSSRAAYCEECYKEADEKLIMDAINNTRPYVCPACSHAMPVKPVDDFIKQIHPKAIGVLNDSEGVDLSKDSADEKISMVVFSCMTCGSGLQISDKSGRMIKCPYCSNENYLPDAIWNKLHPDKDVDPFFVILDIDSADMKTSLDYFLSKPMMRIYEKHFVNFIKEYFENPFINDAFDSWIKIFLSAKNNDKLSTGFNVHGLQNYFFEQFGFGLENQNNNLKIIAATYSVSFPEDLQVKLAKDPDENVRLALAKNPSVSKNTVKILQHDSSPLVAGEAAKHKSGFWGKLFG